MGALGVDFHADANPAHPEWAIRLPHFLLAAGALLAVYAVVSKVQSRRAGLVTAVVLATMPHFFFLSHQAITDMPFVANMTMALCVLGLAIQEDPDREVKRYTFGGLSVSGRHLVIAAISAVVLPQVLYLISRNVTWMHHAFLVGEPPFGWHADTFTSGSVGNHGVPGNSPVRSIEPYMNGPAAQPVVQGLIWLAAYLGLLAMLRRERRAQALYMYAFYLFCGLAFMAKGIPGFALPGLVALLFLIGTKRWNLLLSGRLRVGPGALTVAVVGLPWYVAMYIRHGPPFTNRLLIHDHINRLTAGVHGDTGSIEYFIEQLGFGLFPWIVLAPLALGVWFGGRSEPAGGTPSGSFGSPRDVLVLVALWLASAFTLFSAMTTKFHHYIFPAVPPAAILAGIAFDRMLNPAAQGLDLRAVGRTALALLAPIPVVIGVAGIWGDVRGVIPPEIDGADRDDWVVNHPWPEGVCLALIATGLSLLAVAWWLARRSDDAARVANDVPWARGAITTGLVTGPPLLAMIGRDLSWVTDARPQGYERLIHLFVYNYGRPWPDHFDYRPMLTGFAVVAVGVMLVAAIRPVRDTAMRAFLGVALAFCVWSLDVYLIDLSPHWGQRELVHRYYELRGSPEEPLVAWQMNWKGENFYSGNRVHVFVDLDNRALRSWLAENPGRRAWFLLEHSRLNNLRGILRDSTIQEITDERFDNKFILLRVDIGGERRAAAGRSAPVDRPAR